MAIVFVIRNNITGAYICDEDGEIRQFPTLISARHFISGRELNDKVYIPEVATNDRNRSQALAQTSFLR